MITSKDVTSLPSTTVIISPLSNSVFEALPPAVIRDGTAHQELSNIVRTITTVIDSNDNQNVLSAIDDAMAKVKSLQRKSVTRK